MLQTSQPYSATDLAREWNNLSIVLNELVSVRLINDNISNEAIFVFITRPEADYRFVPPYAYEYVPPL